jgi:L-threonylcarbamoyladenylate synthase
MRGLPSGVLAGAFCPLSCGENSSPVGRCQVSWKEEEKHVKPVGPIETRVLSSAATGALDLAVEILASGGLVAFPTDTVYGVGAHALLPRAVQRLYSVKGRPKDQPIPLLLEDAAAMRAVCLDIPPLAWELADRFWPGALSLVLRRAPIVPDAVTAGGTTVAVRVPDHTLVNALCRRLKAPLAATSANLHGQPDPVTAEDVRANLVGRIPLILDDGPCSGTVPSTLLDLTVTPPAVLRAGPISSEQLAEFLTGCGRGGLASAIQARVTPE